MQPIYKTAMYIFTLLLLVACGGGASPGAERQFSQGEKTFLYQLFHTEYLWYDQVKTESEHPYTTALDMVRSLRVSPPDKWSFVMTKQEWDNYSKQKTQGFGFSYNQEYRIMVVLIDSPVYTKLQRGDVLLEIDGKPVTQSAISNASLQLGTPVTFKIRRGANEQTVTVTPKMYTHKVTLSKIIPYQGKTVGYLRYDAFTHASQTEIEEAFTQFHQNNIDELVIDLRYNGGGSIATATVLLDNITNAYPGERLIYLDWNDQYQAYNEDYNFAQSSQGNNELSMDRVFFLTTKHSASASELVVSALKPYLGESNIITIGTNTHGKPVGMSMRTYGEKNYFLINFRVKNDDGESTSFDGIPATCSATDDINHLMGDPQEAMLASALYYMVHNACPSSMSQKTIAKQAVEKTIEEMGSPLKIQGLFL